MTLDFYNPNANILVDLRLSPSLPVPSHSMDKVFCSHVIEHLSDESVAKLFRETHRILRYRGIARFSCPDAKLAIRQYKKKEPCDPSGEIVSHAARKAPQHLRLLNIFASFEAPSYQGRTNTKRGYSGGPIVDRRTVAQHIKQDSLAEFGRWAVSLIPEEATYRAHINAHWDAKLKRMLKEAGFTSVRVSQFRRSANLELQGENFDNRPNMSLFIEARAKTRTKWLFWQWHRAKVRGASLLRRWGLRA